MAAENQIIPVANEVLRIQDRKSGLGTGYRPNILGPRKKDRRKALYDRRKGVRDGVIVVLSLKKDRRKNPDRRFQPPNLPLSTDDSNGSGYDIIA